MRGLLVLVLVMSVMLLGAAWSRGPALAGATVEGGGASVTPVVETPTLRSSSTATYSAERPAWTPTPQPGLSRPLAEGEHWKAPPISAIHALAAVAPEREVDMVRIVTCESGWDTTVVGAAGEQGAAQVLARYWGFVPGDLSGQLRQADAIMARHGLGPWSTSGGCERWAR